LIEAGSDINAATTHTKFKRKYNGDKDLYADSTPLITACAEGTPAAIQILLDTPGILLDLSDSTGSRAIHWAAQQARLQIIQQLIDRGCNFKGPSDSRTPLEVAARQRNGRDYGNLKCARVLAEAGCGLSKGDGQNWTVLHHVVYEENMDMVRVLLSVPNPNRNLGVIDVQSGGRTTPLHLASMGTWHGHEEMVKLLLENGYFCDEKDDEGMTPLAWAASTMSQWACALLVEAGAKVDDALLSYLASLWSNPSCNEHLERRVLSYPRSVVD
jgi:ankyrin repeat protein